MIGPYFLYMRLVKNYLKEKIDLSLSRWYVSLGSGKKRTGDLPRVAAVSPQPERNPNGNRSNG
jgi:hypothetical protein